MKLLVLIAVLALVGCQTVSSQLTSQEEKHVVALARRAVAESGILSADEARKINSAEPVLTYYFLARPLADYSLHWKLSDTEEIVVSGRGDILRLEKATIKRQPNQALLPTSMSVTECAYAHSAPDTLAADL